MRRGICPAPGVWTFASPDVFGPCLARPIRLRCRSRDLLERAAPAALCRWATVARGHLTPGGGGSEKKPCALQDALSNKNRRRGTDYQSVRLPAEALGRHSLGDGGSAQAGRPFGPTRGLITRAPYDLPRIMIRAMGFVGSRARGHPRQTRDRHPFSLVSSSPKTGACL